MMKVAAGAKKLGDSIDSLAYNMDKHGVVNQKTKYMLRLLEPFPKTFKVIDVKEKDNDAVAAIGEGEPFPALDTPIPEDFYKKHWNMIGALLPNDPNTVWTTVTLVKASDGWKIQIPVTTRLRGSVDHLKDNATNYANGIKQVSDSVKNNPSTKEQVQSELERVLNESK
jgi:hypothetical protein